MLSYLLAALESEEDKRRFTELYEENHVRAEQTALRILRDPHDAEDAVQNAFLQVIHHFNEISEIPCKKLGFWIISISKPFQRCRIAGELSCRKCRITPD